MDLKELKSKSGQPGTKTECMESKTKTNLKPETFETLESLYPLYLWLVMVIECIVMDKTPDYLPWVQEKLQKDLIYPRELQI